MGSILLIYPYSLPWIKRPYKLSTAVVLHQFTNSTCLIKITHRCN